MQKSALHNYAIAGLHNNYAKAWVAYESISKKIKKTGSFWTKNGAATTGDRSRGPEGAHSRELVHIIA